MAKDILKIHSISELHEILGLPKPKHPLITLIDASKLDVKAEDVGTKVIPDFYMISLKDGSCGMEYGRNSFDFEEGVMVFSAPGQGQCLVDHLSGLEIRVWDVNREYRRS